jgi:cell division protein FtsI (penicillin-binding protein 3)
MRRHTDPIRRARLRLRVVAVLFGIAFASLALRLVDLLPSQPSLVADARARPGEPARGRPDLVDRHGVLLATDLRLPSLFADPSLIRDPQAAAEALARVLPGIEAATLVERLRQGRRFAWIKHLISPEEQAAVLELGLPGIGFRSAEHRVYPQARLASHLIGFVDIDNRGLAGIEYGLDHGLVPGPVGERLALSIDLRLQGIVQTELRRAVSRFRAVGACGLVMDIATGELLAMASVPDFDPNMIETASAEERRNRCTGGSYELGSIFKIVTTAFALDSGRVRLGDEFDAINPLRIGRHTIRDDHAKRRALSVPEIFMYSSNIGTARMAFAAGGNEDFRAFLERLGLMRRQSLEIPETASPQLPRRWAEVTGATVAFGHGLAVTPLQFLGATAALLGDGTRVTPTVVRRDGAPPAADRLVDPRTVEALRLLMWLTVAEGTGTRGRLDAYLVGGKTGTAEKVDPRSGRYLRDRVLASFLGAYPIDAPRYLVLVVLDDPRGDAATHGLRYGGWTAAPIVAEIMDRAGPLLGLPRAAPGADAGFRERLVKTKIHNPRTNRAETRFAAARPVR